MLPERMSHVRVRTRPTNADSPRMREPSVKRVGARRSGFQKQPGCIDRIECVDLVAKLAIHRHRALFSQDLIDLRAPEHAQHVAHTLARASAAEHDATLVEHAQVELVEQAAQ